MHRYNWKRKTIPLRVALPKGGDKANPIFQTNRKKMRNKPISIFQCSMNLSSCLLSTSLMCKPQSFDRIYRDRLPTTDPKTKEVKNMTMNLKPRQLY